MSPDLQAPQVETKVKSFVGQKVGWTVLLMAGSLAAFALVLVNAGTKQQLDIQQNVKRSSLSSSSGSGAPVSCTSCPKPTSASDYSYGWRYIIDDVEVSSDRDRKGDTSTCTARGLRYDYCSTEQSKGVYDSSGNYHIHYCKQTYSACLPGSGSGSGSGGSFGVLPADELRVRVSRFDPSQ